MDSNPLAALGNDDDSSDSTASDSEDDMVLTRLVDSPPVQRKKSPEKKKKKDSSTRSSSSSSGKKPRKSSDHSKSHSSSKDKSKAKPKKASSGLSDATMAKLAALEEQEKKAAEKRESLSSQLEREQKQAKAKKEKQKKERKQAQKLKLESIAAPLVDLEKTKKQQAIEEEQFVSPRRVIEVNEPAPKSPRPEEQQETKSKPPAAKKGFTLNLAGAMVPDEDSSVSSDDDSEDPDVKAALSEVSSDSSSDSSSDDDSSSIDLAALAAQAGMGGDGEELAALAALDAEREEALDDVAEDDEEREARRKKREAKKKRKKKEKKEKKKRMKEQLASATKEEGEEYFDNVIDRGEEQREEQRRMKKEAEARKKASKLRFIGQQFANMKVDIKALVEEEKAKAEVYDFEWERKEKDPNWKQGLLKASIKPEEGLDYLAQQNLIEDSLEGRARWLEHYRVDILDNEAVIDWISQGENFAMLEALVDQENNFLGYDMEMAFRRFIWQMDNLPPDSDGLKRVFQAFGAKYRGDNPSRQKVKSAEAASFLCNAMLVLSNAFHHSQYAPDSNHSSFIKNCAGQNAGQDFDNGMLTEIYNNVVTCPIDFRVTCLYPEAVKLGFCLVRSYDPSKKRDKSVWKKKWCVLNSTNLEIYENCGEPEEVALDLKTSEYISGITTSKPCFGVRELGQDVVHVIVPLSDWAGDRWNWWVKRESHDSDELQITLSNAVVTGPKMLSPRGKKGSPFGKKKKKVRGKKGATINLTESPVGQARIDRSGDRVRNFDSEESDE